MSETTKTRQEKHICAALVAHVDSGKTTLSESILYLSGKIRKPGRVDYGDSYFDTYELERSRGITIFSKQAEISLGDSRITLLDTPGHVDFSAEMERTLPVLDYAVLVINGADGVQGHTRTLWDLLQRYRIPTFLFVNKMDQEGTEKDALLRELQRQLHEGCLDFSVEEGEEFWEAASMSDEEAMEEYLETDSLSQETLQRLIRSRKIYPCYFGSALKMEGVEEFLAGLQRYLVMPEYEDVFGAKVYKITRDGNGNRLTHMKITGGSLKVKDSIGEEKVNQIRIYSGEKYDTASEVFPGMVCAVTGVNETYPGQGLGEEAAAADPVLEPVLNYRVMLPEGVDAHRMLKNIQELEEEDPMLRVVWNEELGEIYVQLMGEIQIEILSSLIRERFGVEVSFDEGNIVYKETIRKKAEGVGHFEPLRHYAEVHLLLEPGKPGSGLLIDSRCSEDVLDKNWQRLILTHLWEKDHRGVLTGSVITDMKITLVAGRAHAKHTEGGDFRQATYRAVRQGLMQAESVLLEPYYEFRLEIPAESVGRALNDIQMMCGEFEPPLQEGEEAVIIGTAPAASMRGYQRSVAEYTRGRGRFSCRLKGYAECHNPEEVLAAKGYDPQRDIENPTGSVFCAHGAGFPVPWDQVFDYMHLERQWKEEEQESGKTLRKKQESGIAGTQEWSAQDEKELEDIFIRTYGRIERKRPPEGRQVISGDGQRVRKKKEAVKEYLLVDGYNIIFAWEDLKELARENVEAARNRLMDILSNYQGFKKCVLILVFDAYKREGESLEILRYQNIHVVYTKEAETADQYIEKVVHEIGRKYRVTVATSDGVEQVITAGQGARLMSAREFREEIELTNRQIQEEWELRRKSGKNYLFDHMDEELARQMELVRLGKEE